jgi:hypothetical protein
MIKVETRSWSSGNMEHHFGRLYFWYLQEVRIKGLYVEHHCMLGVWWLR